ncbi:hypothetical protein [Sinorhizobium medicae]
MTGIFVLEGMTLRIPRISISIDDNGNLSSEPITLEVAYDACIAWGRIALTHRAEAIQRMEDRKAVWSDETREGDERARVLVEEFRASIQAVVASAICIDALYDHLVPHSGIPETTRAAWARKKTPRYVQVAETIRSTFRVKPDEAKKLKENLTHLFKLRDVAVHPSNMPRQPHKHPQLDIATDWVFTTFRGDVADVFVCIALGIVWDITRASKYKNTQLSKFIEEFRKRVEELLPDGKPVPLMNEVTAFLPANRRNINQAASA